MPVEFLRIQKRHNLVVFGDQCHWKRLQQIQDLRAILHCAAGQLANDEWVTQHLPTIQELPELVVAMPKMMDPYGRVNERHAAFPAAACERFSASSLFRQDVPIGARSL